MSGETNMKKHRKVEESPLNSKLGSISLIVKTILLVLVVMAVFFQDLIIIFNDALRTETTSYILAVPFILVYVIYRKRRILMGKNEGHLKRLPLANELG